MNSFTFIKDYIVKCIYDKINAYADSIAFYANPKIQTEKTYGGLYYHKQKGLSRQTIIFLQVFPILQGGPEHRGRSGGLRTPV